MSNPIFYPGRLAGVAFTGSEAADASYPLTNLSTYDPDDKWQSNTTAANQTLNIDLGSAKTVDFVAFENHNFDAIADLSIKLQYDSADNPAFSSPADAYTMSGHGNGRLIAAVSSVSKRYWRIMFASTGALSAKPYLGNLFIGEKFAPAYTFVFPYSAKNERFTTARARSISGKLRTAYSFGGILTWKIRFDMMDNTWLAAWLKFHQAVKGAACPFYYTDQDGATWYVALSNDSNDAESIRYQLNSGSDLTMESFNVDQNPL